MCSGPVLNSSTTPRQVLPGNVKPSNYKLAITPDLETLRFDGTVKIDLKVIESTSVIVCNQNELEIFSATVGSHSATITLDQENELATFTFDSEFKAGTEIVLDIVFKGTHNDKMAGFYKSSYTLDGVKKNMVVTQFEATDCRRCFPSWDEPNLKATFEITLNVPKDRTALSNMHVKSQKDVKIGGKDLVEVAFHKTPIMSTYLVAMCVGEFEYLEAIAKPKLEGAKEIHCRVFTLPGQREMGRFALGVCTKTLEFFSEYFDIAYPLPKMDMIAIPDFGAGAMENWGLVTYRETALLWDEKKSSAKAKERVAYVVGHELAHQWFGNLVTMDWWSELWLNEGFATFVGWLAVDNIFPDWNVFTSFVTGEFTSGVGLDSLRSSHAIEVDVKSPAEINQIFDAISYSKGASVIRMLNSFLGGNVFQKGVCQYLKKHQYSNARTVDLWDALGKASGIDVTKMMYHWTRDVGYPMVSIKGESYNEAKKDMTLDLSQTRFLSTGDLTKEEEEKCPTWFVPIGVVTDDKTAKVTVNLTGKTGQITFPYKKSSTSFYKLNANTTGFYRVRYVASQLENLGKAIGRDITAFSTQDRIGIISDAFAFARAGLGSTIGALEILKSFKHEEEEVVLGEISSKFAALKKAWYKDAKAIKGLQALQREIFSPKVVQLGYDYPEKEDHLIVLKRNLCIASAASANDENVINELLTRFKKYVSGQKDAFHPNLRETVFKTVLKHSSQSAKDFDSVMEIYKNAATADEKIAALSCIGASNDLEVCKRVLNEIVLDSEIVRLQDIMYPVASLVSDCPHKEQILEIVWVWVTSNWTILHQKLAGTISLLGRILQFSISQNIGEDFALKVEAWAAGKDCSNEKAREERIKQVKDAKRPLEQALEAVRGNTKWYEREKEVSAWLVAKA